MGGWWVYKGWIRRIILENKVLMCSKNQPSIHPAVRGGYHHYILIKHTQHDPEVSGGDWECHFDSLLERCTHGALYCCEQHFGRDDMIWSVQKHVPI